MKEVGDEWIAPYALPTKVGERHSLWQPARIRDLDSIVVNLNEDIAAIDKSNRSPSYTHQTNVHA